MQLETASSSSNVRQLLPDEEGKRNCDDFLILMKNQWNAMINARAFRFLNDKKQLADLPIPVAQDLLTLKHFLDAKILSCQEALEKETTIEAWKSLAECTLVRIVLFNKRRGGEAQRLKVNHYIDRPKWASVHNTDILDSLSETEKKLCSKMELIKIPGKRKPVPVLLSPSMKQCVDTLVEKKEHLNIVSDYVFANPHSKAAPCNPLRSWDLLMKFSVEAGLEKPELMTSTNLRKYTCTVSQIMQLEENELEWLCTHMGHSIDVHRNFYRLPTAALELAKISKLLIASEEGNVHQFAGQNLKSIEIHEQSVNSFLCEGATRNICRRDLASGEVQQSEQSLSSSCNSSAEVSSSRQQNNSEFSGSQSNMDSPGSHQNNPNLAQSSNTDSPNLQLNLSSAQSDMLESSQCSPKVKRFKWDTTVKSEAIKHFSDFILQKKTPGKTDCLNYMKSQNLNLKSWQVLKNMIKNEYYVRN